MSHLESRSIVCESSLPQLCKFEVLSTRFDDYTRTARLEQQLQDLFFCRNVDLSWFVHQLRITNVTRSPCRSFNAFGHIAGSPWLGWWWAPELCQSCTHHYEGASPSTRPESLCNTHSHRKSWKHVLLLEQSRCDTSSYSYKCWYCHLQIEELAVNIKEQSQLSDWHVSCGGGISTYSDSEAFQACTYILVRSCILLAVRHSDTTSKCPARMLSHRQVWQCLCNEQWPTQRCVGFIEVMQWCSYVVQLNVEKNLHEVMKSTSVSLRPVWSPHFNVLWIGEWFTAASGALKTFTKSPRVLTFDEANPTRMTEQCAILVWLLVHRMTTCKNFDIIWHFPRLHDASSCWGYVRWPARDEKQSQDCVLVCEGEIVAKRCKKVFEVCALYFAERSVYTGRKYALRVETDAFQQAFLQLWLWIQPNLDFVASVRNANIREILYKGFCKRSSKTVIVHRLMDPSPSSW